MQEWDGGRHEKIARRAYSLFEQRGRADGRDLDDWLEAERQLEVQGPHRNPRPVSSGSQPGQRKEPRTRRR